MIESIPFESEVLGNVEVFLGELRLTARIFRTPDKLVAVHITLPKDGSLQLFADAQVNTQIRDTAIKVAGQAPDFYQLRYDPPA
ncbi:MAG: hypothetical protein Q8Q09_18635 [Deltaproteobacteria bacterium]|nr:hypothetical protein [Deltaproteobacteria bacterium]